ncbi:MAG: ribosome biosis GTPase Der, partial [Hyphomicrobiales bacterium]|nr:ribosome biosis GTPase Der [Hyphomicrobiales bacterium]
SYERFLINGLRETFDLKGVPIRITKRMNQNPFDKGKKRH